MASGDTKTEAMLNVLGNGGSGDEFRGCCNTKTQSYILDAIDRINAIQPGGSSDFNDLSNRPQLNGAQMTGNTNITNFVGTDGQTAGAQGLVPAPATTDADKFLKSDGTWATAGGGGGPTVVQQPGTSQTDVMSQKAVTSLIYTDPGLRSRVRISNSTDSSVNDSAVCIGWNTTAYGEASTSVGSSAGCQGRHGVAVGYNAQANAFQAPVAIGNFSVASGGESTAVGNNATADGSATLALGAYSTATESGEVSFPYCQSSGEAGVINCGPFNTSYGYDNTNYRLITGVHDAVDSHDAVTLGQLNTLITNLNQALGTAIPLLGNANNANNNSGSAQTVTCPFCGQETDATSTICQNCGSDMTSTPYDPGEGGEPGPEEPVDPGEEPIAPEEPSEEPVEG